ncbi:MAG: hypothetical protein KatS3mg098_393 [Candidatus Parcubacteria bacterium]|nr:hypothetical protein [Patescibacteria group bacterium]BCX16164.1 MAG: hypothetical protein KatS3mg098_393 [Candidatus Parcubacteria bacterium]
MKSYFLRLKIFLKERKKEILLIILAFLIIALAFALGYLTGRDFLEKTPIIINKYSC